MKTEIEKPAAPIGLLGPLAPLGTPGPLPPLEPVAPVKPVAPQWRLLRRLLAGVIPFAFALSLLPVTSTAAADAQPVATGVEAAPAAPPEILPPGQRIVMLTEPNPPYSFQSADGAYHGLNIDQIQTIAADAGIPITIDIMPWARALATGETEPLNCVFSTARTPDREARFKWVAPLGIARRLLVKRTGSPVKAATIEDAKAFVVGTYRDDFTEGLLHKLAFPNIDTSPDIETMLRKLMAGHIDLMPMSGSMLRRIDNTDKSVERVVTLSEQPVGIACNTSVPDAVIARLQTSLDHFLVDGRQQTIYQRYGIAWPP